LYEAIDILTDQLSPEVSINEEKLLDGVAGDRHILRKLVGIFLKDSPRMLQNIKKSLSRNGVELASAAHALKGSAANFGPNAVTDMAKQLEQIGKSGDLASAPNVFEKLQDELKLLQRRLQSIR